MANIKITVEFNNGYSCSCCSYNWEQDYKVYHDFIDTETIYEYLCSLREHLKKTFVGIGAEFVSIKLVEFVGTQTSMFFTLGDTDLEEIKPEVKKLDMWVRCDGVWRLE